MSVMHYISADKELPIGGFGFKPIEGEEKRKYLEMIYQQDESARKGTILELIDFEEIDFDSIIVFRTIEDASGIYVYELSDSEKDVVQIFKNRFVYRLEGIFYFSEKMKERNLEIYKARKKELNVLFEYISSNITDEEIIEVYSCEWGKWTEKPKIITEIDLSTFVFPEEFELRCGEYIIFKKSKST
ncbi:hypothetical protein Csac_0512 [Caldicellulosiruptor saccharolyticus DSM 8903]|uniref:Uncharacterized protein n=1 Tax=Caldicellulosiruptor saccharolyticus (strain ATCC 43494 / DSM 8903 / Tp8T 6331) TaxID=351627 RepID=A4XGW3_CALS8|nr:hypothetical protein [Caldicellulosiruptor saccharolyticus]ABP66148.1 hypothetical protein Csac_0512 [Caldicellulosiruptor saccharolyticus DSM 8903]